jgi:hypothetical protein
MSPMLNALATFWWRWPPAFGGAAWGAAIAVPFVVIELSLGPTDKERKLCTEAIDTVLTTKDPVELGRAKFLVEQLRGCRIRL